MLLFLYDLSVYFVIVLMELWRPDFLDGLSIFDVGVILLDVLTISLLLGWVLIAVIED